MRAKVSAWGWLYAVVIILIVTYIIWALMTGELGKFVMSGGAGLASILRDFIGV